MTPHTYSLTAAAPLGRSTHVTLRLLLLTMLAVLGAAACRPDSASVTARPGDAVEPNAVVTRVVDGDTILVDVTGREQSVRLLGIDTPESVARDRPVECFGPEAGDFTRSLLPSGTRVRLERDLEARDRYDRLLAYVYRADDGLFVNLALAEHGFADLLVIEPNEAHATTIAAAVSMAKAAPVGLWAACGSADVAQGDQTP